MKKLNIFLIVAIFLGLTACGGGSESSDNKESIIVTCNSNQELVNGVCVDKQPETTVCDENQELVNGVCVDKQPETTVCDENQELVNGVCVDKQPETTVCDEGQTLVDGVCVTPPVQQEVADYIDLSNKGYQSLTELTESDTYAYKVNFQNNEFYSLTGIESIFSGIKSIDFSFNTYFLDMSELENLVDLEEVISTDGAFHSGICVLNKLDKLKNVVLKEYGSVSNKENDFTCLNGIDVEKFDIADSKVEDNTDGSFLNSMSSLKHLDLHNVKLTGLEPSLLYSGNMTYIDVESSNFSSGSFLKTINLEQMSGSYETLDTLKIRGDLQNVAALKSLTNIRVLSISSANDYTSSSNFNDFFTSMNKLQVLDISNSSFNGQPSLFEDLSSLFGKEKLVELNISGNNNTIDYVDSEALASLSNLKKVDISSNNVETFEFLASLDKLEDFKMLDYTRDSDREILTNLSRSKGLKFIEIVSNTTDINTDLTEWTSLQNLITVYISLPTSFVDNVDLSFIEHNPNLKVLSMPWAISDNNFSKLVSKTWGYLDLSTNSLDDISVLDQLNFENNAEVRLPKTFESGHRNVPFTNKLSKSGKFCQAWLKGDIKVKYPTLNGEVEHYCED